MKECIAKVEHTHSKLHKSKTLLPPKNCHPQLHNSPLMNIKKVTGISSLMVSNQWKIQPLLCHVVPQHGLVIVLKRHTLPCCSMSLVTWTSFQTRALVMTHAHSQFWRVPPNLRLTLPLTMTTPSKTRKLIIVPSAPSHWEATRHVYMFWCGLFLQQQDL